MEIAKHNEQAFAEGQDGQTEARNQVSGDRTQEEMSAELKGLTTWRFAATLLVEADARAVNKKASTA